MTEATGEPVDDPGAADFWRHTVTTAVRQAGGDTAEDLLDSVSFLDSLNGLVDVDPADPRLAAGVAAAVEQHLAGRGIDYRTADPEQLQAEYARLGFRPRHQ